MTTVNLALNLFHEKHEEGLKGIVWFLNQNRKSFSDQIEMSTPITLIDEVTNQIDAPKSSTVGVMFTFEWALYMKYHGWDDVTLLVNKRSANTEKFCELLGIKYKYLGDVTSGDKMKFDVVVGNPPFNESSDDDKTRTGVSGKTGIFKKFTKLAAALVVEDGTMAFITPKGITRTLKTDPILSQFELINLSYMSQLDVWVYDTCYFIVKNNGKGINQVQISDPIFSKFIDLMGENVFESYNLNKSDKELVREGAFTESGEKVIRYLPGRRGPNVIYDTSSDSRIIRGPKTVVTHLDSYTSITATNEPLLAGTTMSYFTESLEDAEKLALFFRNSKLIKFAKKKLKRKKVFLSFSQFKKFDISQIITGFEYPKEYNLTQEEIGVIESEV